VKELTDEKRLLLAFLAMIVVLFVWGHFYKPPAPPPPTKTPSAPALSNSSPSATTASASAAAGATSETASSQAVPSAAATQAAAETTFVVENNLYRIEFSNRGAVAHSWKLKSYLNDDKPPQPLDLVNRSACQQLNAWPLSLYFNDPQLEAKANSALYQVSPSPASTANATIESPATIEFHWSDGHLDIVKTISLTADYQAGLKISATLDGKLLPTGVGWRGGFGDVNAQQQAAYLFVFYAQNGKLSLLPVKKLGSDGHQEIPNLQPGPAEYAGIEDQFFAAAFLPNNAPLNLWDWVQQHDIGNDERPAQEPEAQLAVGLATPAPLDMRLFVGPKDLRVLGHLRPQLEGLVNLGWFGIIAKPLLQVLQWLHRFVPNWGWSIVVLTLLINMALFPVKLSGFRSMKKMGKIQPEISTIQNRYKKYSMSDPRKRKMNEEVMAVYQREGINPLSSCFPMLIQLPFLWAFYRMLGGSIELRHAPWFGWIHDLSARDPYYILPLVMMASTFLMQRLTPTPTADPTQQKMAQLMPIFLGFIFFRLSAGLNLYYFTSNLVGIGQQYFLTTTDPTKSPAPAPKLKKVADSP
jgi:YidC/Oxa1 family membrane protein insertase